MNMWKALPSVAGVAAMLLLAGCADDSATPAVTTETVTVSAAPAAPVPVVTTTVVLPPQAPVVAENILFDKGVRPAQCGYDGYGSCPLTVERGKIVLAEFLYGGKVAPSFPPYIIDGMKPSRTASGTATVSSSRCIGSIRCAPNLSPRAPRSPARACSTWVAVVACSPNPWRALRPA